MKVMLKSGAYMPERAHSADAGYDLRTPVNVYVPANGSAVVDTGVCMAIPEGYVGFLKSKSGLNVKYDLTGEGVIDSGFAGSITVKLYNHGNEGYLFNCGDKLIQIVLLPIFTPELELVERLDDSERGCNGFGSTGK